MTFNGLRRGNGAPGVREDVNRNGRWGPRPRGLGPLLTPVGFPELISCFSITAGEAHTSSSRKDIIVPPNSRGAFRGYFLLSFKKKEGEVGTTVERPN
jgi:hypothetical protein